MGSDLSTPSDFLSRLVDANHHRGGITCLRLFRVNDDFFAKLRGDVLNLLARERPSAVSEVGHVTHWTRPYGEAVQFSLLNRSGEFDDTSADHVKSLAGKRFHHGALYPALAEFMSAFPHAYNMRLNGMGPGGGLSPHEEHIVLRRRRTIPLGAYYLRARFHLPLFTNDRAEMQLEGDYVHFEEGSIYFFNNGCVHAASNGGSEPRYHLVWDMMLTRETFDLMFSDSLDLVSPFLTKLIGEAREVQPHRHVEVGEYAIEGLGERIHTMLRLRRLGIRPHVFQNWYNRLSYFGHTRLGRVEFAAVDAGRAADGPAGAGRSAPAS